MLFDIICLVETHLKDNSQICVDDYLWFGQNRTELHHKAKKGSGGIGILVHKRLLKVFSVKCIENSYEGILWIKFTGKQSKEVFTICCCYLPPENSNRGGHCEEFFDTLLSNIYKFQDLGHTQICGDLNARCSDMPDFIEGVDLVKPRKVVDFVVNSQGKPFIDFCISVNMCSLNGRFDDVCNNYTCVVLKKIKSLCRFMSSST